MLEAELEKVKCILKMEAGRRDQEPPAEVNVVTRTGAGHRAPSPSF